MKKEDIKNMKLGKTIFKLIDLGILKWGDSVEQSKTPKEEQCEWGHCHRQGCKKLPKPHSAYSCEPKTESISIEKGRELVKKIQAKTEDTGECKNCNGKGYNTVFTGIRISPDFIGDVEYNEKPKINKVPCRICKATGVSKEATNEDSHDTLSPSENKEESMEDRLYDLMDSLGFIPVSSKHIVKCASDREAIKSFIQSEISKAVAKERESITSRLKQFWQDDAPGLSGREAIDEFLSLLNSKKGKE